MARCPNQECGGYLIYEPELAETGASEMCGVRGCALIQTSRKEQPRYFPTELVNKRIGWQQEFPG